jgi:hypothetical protein
MGGDARPRPQPLILQRGGGATRIVGQETVQYVSNVYKYDIAYRLLAEREASLAKAKKGAVSATTSP